MKHLKEYESLNKTIRKKYILATDFYTNNKKLLNFLSNSIGKVISENSNEITAKYDNIPDDILSYFSVIKINEPPKYIAFEEEEIIYRSDNKEDIERYIDINKYNL